MERPIVVITQNYINEVWDCYDGKSYYTCPRDDEGEYPYNVFQGETYVHLDQIKKICQLRSRPNGWKDLTINDQLKHAYDIWTKQIDQLCALSNGKYNLRLTSGINDALKKYAVPTLIIPEPITIEEETIIQLSTKGAWNWDNQSPNINQTLYGIDMNSAYGSILQSRSFYIPISEMTKTPIIFEYFLKNIRKCVFTYGFYHCRLIPPDPVPFLYEHLVSTNDWYTHKDLQIIASEKNKHRVDRTIRIWI